MASGNKQASSKKANTGAILQQQDVLQAVVIAEIFNDEFAPLTKERPSALFPLVNKYLLEYALESLEKCGIQETFVFCSQHPQLIRNYVQEKWPSEENCSMTVTVVSSEKFMSVGDVIRELDSKALIRSDFVLINGHVVNTFPLVKLMEEHKKVRKTDKGCAITLLYRKVFPKHRTRTIGNNVLLAVDTSTQRVRFYHKVTSRKTVRIPLQVFQECDDITVHYDVLDSHVCICSPSVPPLYSDNFDFQTFDDLLRGLIINEEVLGNSIYLHITCYGYGASITNLFMYDFISQDIIQRWSYPIVPDLFHTSSRYSCLQRLIYKDTHVDLHRDCILHKNVVLGRGTIIGENTSIEASVIGHNCTIGANVKIKGCYLWDNVVIGDKCSLEMCLLADNVVLKSHVTIGKGCVLSSKVVIDDYVALPSLKKLQSEQYEEDDGFGDKEEKNSIPEIPENIAACDPLYVGVNGRGYLYVESSNDEDENFKRIHWGQEPVQHLSDDEDNSSSDEADVASEQLDEEVPEEEDTTLFYNEVLDSLQRGIDEKIKCENLILEINSSKYAYNVTMKEVNCLMMKAILSLPPQTIAAPEYFAKLKPILLSFIPLIANYIKNVTSQIECLQSMTEFFTENQQLSPVGMKILHVLYDKEVLNETVIIKWYDNLSVKSIKKLIEPFIKWLKEADEESSED